MREMGTMSSGDGVLQVLVVTQSPVMASEAFPAIHFPKVPDFHKHRGFLHPRLGGVLRILGVLEGEHQKTGRTRVACFEIEAATAATAGAATATAPATTMALASWRT